MPATLENRIDQSQRTWDADRPVMAQNNRDLLQLAVLYEDEHHELLDAWVGYLTDPKEATKEDVLQESADVVLFITQLIHILGSTLEQTVMDKRAYNISRYTASNFQEGEEYSEGIAAGRQWVKERNWKSEYYGKDVVPLVIPEGKEVKVEAA